MRPFGWWRPTYAGAACGCGPGAGTESAAGSPFMNAFWGGWGEGGHFGVRRPLRFLAYKLGLDDAQVSELARILDELKTERAQAAVDDRRTLSAFADAISGEAFNQARANEGATLRETSADHVRAAVLAALPKIHKLLNPEQRERFAYLIRSGTLTL